MTNLEKIHLSEDIHLSVADAEDLEEVRDEEISVLDVFRSLVQHPAQLITRWNWKAALLGALLRASFYFTVYKASKESWSVTLTAVLVEFSFRFFTSGISGALVQSLLAHLRRDMQEEEELHLSPDILVDVDMPSAVEAG